MRISLLKRSFDVLLPSFFHQQTHARPEKLHPTSYLDGIRGIAALIVFIYHMTGNHFKHFIPYYGTPLAADGSPSNSSIIQLPFLRLIFSGRGMVHVFFVVSGYALSLKPLKQIRARQHSNLQSTLSSSIFRRGLRLYLPLYVSSFLGLILGCLGLKEMEEKTFYTRVAAWLHAMYFYSDFWNIANFSGISIDAHLWTIPLEMAFSMVLFIVVIAFARAKTAARLGSVIVIVVYCLWVCQWAAAEFLLGMILAEIGLIQDSWVAEAPSPDLESAAFLLSCPSTGVTEESKVLSFPRIKDGAFLDRLALHVRGSSLAKRSLQATCIGNFICALWLLGWPDKFNDATPSWKFLYAHTPSIYQDKGLRSVQFFWHCIAAVQVVFACQQVPALQYVFTTRLAQYLGKISFSLYLMHMSVLMVIGPRIVPHALYWITGRWHPKGRGGGMLVFFISGAVIAACLIWVADLFWRFVDVKCVRIARKVEDMFIVQEDTT